MLDRRLADTLRPRTTKSVKTLAARCVVSCASTALAWPVRCSTIHRSGTVLNAAVKPRCLTLVSTTLRPV